MSEALAIPATTFVLKGLIEARLKTAWGNFNPSPVLTAPPPRIAASASGAVPPAEATSVILFCHHAGPNAAWRNMYEPHIDASGKRIGKAPLVLDLHYMLAATGDDLEREAAFGVAVAAFTRNAVIPRAMISAILATVAVPPNPAKFIETLTAEPLGDKASQPEQITLSQAQVDIDMSTKLWSALQSPLRPTAYFLATTVFLDPGDRFDAIPTVTRTDVGVRPDTLAAPVAADDHLNWQDAGPGP